jgi:hypothetical protein
MIKSIKSSTIKKHSKLIKNIEDTFLKFRTIEDKTDEDIEIPVDNVRLSPLYESILRGGIHENDIAIKRWYELYGLPIASYKKYTQHWYIGRSQVFLLELINKQKTYIETLNEEETDTIFSYTFIGDTIINNFMRNDYDTLAIKLYRLMMAMKHEESDKLPLEWQIYHYFNYIIKSGIKTIYKKPDLIDNGILQRDIIRKIFLENDEWFLNPRNIEPLITDLILKMVKIILNAPRSSYPIKVYRGIVSEHIDNLNHISSDFWSTSIAPNGALLFTGKSEVNGSPVQYCIYEITIQPDVPCLYISDISRFTQEFEILLPPFIQYRTSNKVIIKNIYDEHIYNKNLNSINNNLNNINYSSKKVVTITVIADAFNRKGLTYLERKRHWRNVKKQEDIDEYLAKIARKEKLNVYDISVNNNSYLPVSSRRPIRKKYKSTRKSLRKSARESTERSSFKRLVREEERRKTRKLKRSTRRVHTTNVTN